MSNFMKFCSCRACKAGKHCKQSKRVTRRTLRSLRRKNKVATKRADEDAIIHKVSIPYTD